MLDSDLQKLSKIYSGLSVFLKPFISEILLKVSSSSNWLKVALTQFSLGRDHLTCRGEFNIRLYDKNSESDFFFPSTKIKIFFFGNIGNQNIFFRKKPIPLPPWKLNGPSLNYCQERSCFHIQKKIRCIMHALYRTVYI